MISNETFAVVGGDIRQLYLAKKLKKDNNKVSVCGFENFKNLNKLNFKSSDLNNSILNSKYIILPVPITRNGIDVFSPFSNSSIVINESFVSILKNKVVFGGIVSFLLEDVNKHTFLIHDYYKREDFLIPNAFLTAQGALKIFFNETKKSILNSNCLVIGYGRIGKILSKLLSNLGAKVSVSARNEKDRTWAKCYGFKSINVSNIQANQTFDVIFNTVPSIILNEKNLNFFKTTPIIIDVASNPGGVDKSIAENFGIKLIHALGIPGKYFPQSAGEIIANVIYKMIKEENIKCQK